MSHAIPQYPSAIYWQLQADVETVRVRVERFSSRAGGFSRRQWTCVHRNVTAAKRLAGLGDFA
jgi:hypothetical protein